MDTNMELEQIEGHIEKRNEILHELQEICKKNSYIHTIDLDTCSEMDEKRESSMSFAKDILMEMNEKSLNKFTRESYMKCYRCQHLQNIPRNILEDCEKTSLTEQYEADLMFIQAIVWLKSATKNMKDISHEQFRLVFHKQWNNVLHERNEAEIDNKNIRSKAGKRTKRTNATSPFDLTQNRDFTSYNNRGRTNIDSSNNVKHKEHNTLQFGQDTKQNDEYFPETSSNLSNLSLQSTRSCIRSIPDNTHRDNYVIPDSQSEYSSCSDMFKDSVESEDARKANQNGMDNQLRNENRLTSVGLLELASYQSQDELPCYSDSSQTIILESKSDLLINSAEGSSMDMFNESCSLHGERSVNDSQVDGNKWPSKLTTQKLTQNSRISDSNVCINKLTISSNHTGQLNTPVKDDNVILNSRIDCITPRNKSSVLGSFEFPALNVDEKERIPGENQESPLSSLKLSLYRENDENTDSSQVIESSQANRECQREENLSGNMEFMGICGKRRKMEFEHETDTAIQRNTKNEGKRISSKWLKFTLDILNTDDVAFQSMKVILSALQDEKLATQYMKNRHWKNTLEMQAVDAVLNFCEIFEIENKNNACTNEIVQAITHLLDRSIGNTELNKITIITHQISINLELCASMGVCIEIINYLTTKLKSYESTLISLMNSRKANIHDTVNQLHIILYSLKICLEKYRLAFPTKSDNHFEEETTMSVIELWKKQLKFEGVILKESIQLRERRWKMILNEFSTIAIESFVPFTKMSRRLLNILTR